MEEHKEWKKQNTLTAPSDRESNLLDLQPNASPLTEEQTKLAMQELNRNSSFPEIERRYVDPEISLQKIGLVSFVPAKGATPNEQGIYGFAKLRGNYETEQEADERAEYLIRNVDSYHQIYHTYVGRPFPLTISSDYSKEVSRVDLQQQISNAVKEDVKQKRAKEQKEIAEIKRREEELLEDVKKEKENTDDEYTTLRVKKAQLTWTYSEYSKKLKQMVGLIAKARHEIKVLDTEHPELKDIYYNKYIEARKQAGLSIDRATTDETFMRFLVEDLEIPEVDLEYKELYGDN